MYADTIERNRRRWPSKSDLYCSRWKVATGCRRCDRSRPAAVIRSDLPFDYFDENELRALNNLVEQYLVFAELQAQRQVPMKMGNGRKANHERRRPVGTYTGSEAVIN